MFVVSWRTSSLCFSTRKALLLLSVQRTLPNLKWKGIDAETCLPDSTVQHAATDETWIFLSTHSRIVRVTTVS